MVTVTIEEFQRDLLVFLKQVEEGETLVIADSNIPIAVVKPIVSTGIALRPVGLCAGEFTLPASFDDPLPETLIAEFEGR